MIIDSSALVAILLNEPEAQAMTYAIDSDEDPILSAVNFFEAGMVIQSRRGDKGVHDLDIYLITGKVGIVPFTEQQARTAREAFRKYGKGHHPAGLNFGDCIAYALAKETGEPLLFKGTDFDKTDIATVDIGSK